MLCTFRYADRTSDAAVSLHLSRTATGAAYGDVKGPEISHLPDQISYLDTLSNLPLDRAFALAIRMANRNDLEIVVSGDRSLWDSSWGTLTQFEPTSLPSPEVL